MQVTIKDVVDEIIDCRGKTPKKLGAGWATHGVPAISAKNIKHGLIIREDTIRYVDEATYEKWMKVKVRTGDVLMTSEAPLGETYYVKNSEPLVLSQRLFALRTKTAVLDPKYFYLYTKTRQFKRTLETYGTGATVSGIRQQLLWKVPLEIPDIQTQKKVADIAYRYEDLIENNLKRIVTLEEMAKMLYGHYFQGADSCDWSPRPLGDCLVVHRGKSYKSSELSDSGGISFVNLKCVNRGGGFRKDGIKHFTGSFKPTQQVFKGDIVVAVTDMTQDRMIVARPARVPSLDGGFGVVSMDLVKIDPRADFEKDYIYALLRWSNFADEVKNHANGANVLHLLPARITSFEMPIAPIELQKKFAENAQPIFDLIDNLQLKNESLRATRALLLPRLISGEVKV